MNRPLLPLNLRRFRRRNAQLPVKTTKNHLRLP